MVSVIIPAYNAEKTISNCLNALSDQDYKEPHEIIVVDDGSSDSTTAIVSGYPKVRLVKQKNSGPASARNTGAANAKGEFILFTDSDCIPEKNWISEMISPFNQSSDIAGVKGIYKTHQKEITARFVQLEYEDKYDYMSKNKFIDFIDTYSAVFSRDVFLEMKGYDTEFPVACAEDVELSFRLSKKGYKMVFNPEAVVYHIHPASLTAYLKKKYKFAYWRIVAVRKNPQKAVKDSHTPQMMKIQLLFPPVILGSLIAFPFMNVSLYLSIVMSVIFLFTTIPFASKAVKKDIATGILSPIFLFLRAAAQFLGIFGGILYILRSR